MLSCREKDTDISSAQDAIDEYKVSVLIVLLLADAYLMILILHGIDLVDFTMQFSMTQLFSKLFS